MKNDLDIKIYLALDKIEHQIRRAAYLSTAEPFQEVILYIPTTNSLK